MTAHSLYIAGRFCGPPRSGNGGYVCGRLAAALGSTASVRLKAPPPLETDLTVESSPSGTRLLDGANVIAEAKPATLDLEPPAPPSFADAERAAKSYVGFKHHVFPRCFVCGPQRAAGDGLRIFPGALSSGSMVAAPWVPDASLAERDQAIKPEFLWAALDCTSAFALLPIAEGKAIVLGELCARVASSVRVGEKCVVVAWPLAIDGRKRIAGSAVFSGSGEAIAVGRALWIEVDASTFGGR